MAETTNGWQFWVDRGGTFTDLVARRPDGRVVTHKLLSINPERYDDAAVQGIRDLMGVAPDQIIPPGTIRNVKMGTTVATNALLERKGDRTVLAITEGFADALRIGYQTRPKLFALHIVLPELLYQSVVEIPERIGAHGDIVRKLDEAETRRGLQAAYDDGIRSVAIALMHGYRYADHENRVARIAEEIGFTQISVSNHVSPMMKLVSRGDTAVVDAYLSPILRRYVDRVAGELDADGGGGPRLFFMQSNGGLTDAHRFQGKDAILSGPAGGVVGMAKTAAMAGFDKVIGFDMGGTSTDVSHFDGEFERSFETLVAGVRLRAPMMHIHTVAAGGGSILHFDGARYRVGPDSAGADPGPASYRRGGPLTVTDCNVMLGKLHPDHFPAVFGPNGDQPLDAKIVREKFEALAQDIAKATGVPLQSPEAIAEGFLRIAIENMANAIKKISVERGYDITAYTLNSFGGAGGQHACLVADSLSMNTILLHPFAGVLSAFGMGLADMRSIREQQLDEPLTANVWEVLDQAFGKLAQQARDDLLSQDQPKDRISLVHKVHLRYAGTDNPLLIGPDADSAVMVRRFEDAHRQHYGYIAPDRDLVVEAISVEAVGASEQRDDEAYVDVQHAGVPGSAIADVSMFAGGRWQTAPIYRRQDIALGQQIDGPAIIAERNATTVIEPGWRAELTVRGYCVLTRAVPRPRREAIGTQADPVMLEVFNNLFMSIAEQMGATLANTAYSVNIKERLDFSCAIFAPDGSLVANAPHVPVHLGSMGASIKTVIRENAGRMKPGDAYVVNAPYNGGTHLPDVTVISPVFNSDGRDILFYVASRGHHADIGGRTPGSSPPDSISIHEEGVLIDNFLMVENGVLKEKETLDLLNSGPFPCRNPAQNMADLEAQIAANSTGVYEVLNMIEHFGLDVVQAYMQHVQDNAEESVRRVLDRLSDGAFVYPMDNGCQIQVKIDVDKVTREAVIDFTGTSRQYEGNYNAPTAVCLAAVLYVFRCLVDDDIPLNEGCLKPLKVVVPAKSIISPEYPAAVIAGNTEVSQCITDALFGALGVLASSQGTVNNFVYGNDVYQNYETICGGTGAGPDHPGTSAVHSHMTNTKMTDPEVLEWRFPVRVDSFSIRRGSGGRGMHHGGDGVRREVTFLEAMKMTLLTSHRHTDPYGLAGGGAGARGRNFVRRNNGGIDDLAGNDETDMMPGDTFVMETPGGGAYGVKTAGSSVGRA
ncbi:MAG: hydantoinase B/oxoprolinase family protein [Alphaproteobacteria bacterium]|nr:hydantoinase B/oxoprolinase family protein [Alphaproteobacteria bacterium]